MLQTLYPIFRDRWSATGSVYLISDTHFLDPDCLLMDKHWISPEEHLNIIRQTAHKNDTLIHLGDVGDVSVLEQIPKHKRPYMVLIMGNHDESASRFTSVFDEIYTGPLLIANKLLLSHEPIPGITWAYNIHGHDHDPAHTGDRFHRNLASNVVHWQMTNLKDVIQTGCLKQIKSLHRSTIDKASKQKTK